MANTGKRYENEFFAREAERSNRSYSSLKERSRVKGGFAGFWPLAGRA
jgi:hypothetical protein